MKPTSLRTYFPPKRDLIGHQALRERLAGIALAVLIGLLMAASTVSWWTE